MNSEQQVKKLIHLVLLWSVWTSGTIMFLGLLSSSLFSFNPAIGLDITLAGILLLVLTPVLRLVMLIYGYAKAGERKTALIALLVTLIMVSGFLMKK